MSIELIDRLRSVDRVFATEAADRIEQLEKVLAEWFDKTEWVQKTSDWQELGMHRADALKQRIEQLERENAELQHAAGTMQIALDGLKRENAALEKRLQEIQRMCLGYQAEHAGLRNSTLEEAAIAFERGDTPVVSTLAAASILRSLKT